MEISEILGFQLSLPRALQPDPSSDEIWETYSSAESKQSIIRQNEQKQSP